MPGDGSTDPLGVINDRYELLGIVGSGGMGVVYRARDRVLNRVVAVKVIREEMVDEEFLRRFEREAAILARVRSPHIVVVFDYGSSQGRFYLVTDFLADGDLADLVARHGPLAPKDAAPLLAGLADGLSDAHANGVIHRDIKPGNVLLWRRGDELRPVLADFGIAVTADLGLTATGGVIGSPPFMAPERHLGRPATEATDIYAMGCLAYNLLTGAPPFSGTGFQMANAHINDPVPPLPAALPGAGEWDAVIGRCMAKEPADRYSSAAELASALRALGRPAPPPPPTVLPDTVARPVPVAAPAGPSPRRTASRVLAVLLTLLVVAGAGAAWWLLRDDDEATPPGDTPDAVEPATPGEVEADVAEEPLAVAVSVRLPEPEDGTSLLLEREDDGAWRVSEPELTIATAAGGDRECVSLRLVAVAGDQRAEGPATEVCGKSAPAGTRLVAALAESCDYPFDEPAPDGSTTTPCRWYDALLTGYEADQFVTVRLFWVVDGTVRTRDVADVRVRIGADGSGAAGQHQADSENSGLCPASRCPGGFAVPELVDTVELQVVDEDRRTLSKERIELADIG